MIKHPFCRSLQGGWRTLKPELPANYWYPTLLNLPDQRVLSFGGSTDGFSGIFDPRLNIFNVNTSTVTSINTTNLLTNHYSKLNPPQTYNPQSLLGYYPAMHLLPYVPAGPQGTYHFVHFSADHLKVFQMSPTNVMSLVADTPLWPMWMEANNMFTAQGSASGSYVFLKLEPANNYASEMVMFGGFKIVGPQDGLTCLCNLPNSPYSMRIKLDQASINGPNWWNSWMREVMPGPRSGVDSVVLPNGKVVLLNGGSQGLMSGNYDGGGSGGGPVLAAWMYEPDKASGQRFTVLASSTIYRLYHSVAFLLADGSIFVAGSEQSTCGSTCGLWAPALIQYQAERYKPYYFFGSQAVARPAISSVSATRIALGSTVTVRFQGTVTGAALTSPAAITHQNNMNQVTIGLEILDASVPGQVVLRMPPRSGVVAPPGPYMLWLMNRDLPAREATWVTLTF